MKKSLWSAIAVALLMSMASWAAAQEPALDDEDAEEIAAEMKPVVVISLSGYAELNSDLEMLGQLADKPDLAQSLDGMLQMFTQGQGLRGLDEERPWGAAVSTDGMQFQMLAYLPVTDVEELLNALANVAGQPEDLGDGLWQLQGEMTTLFVKEQKGWAFIAQDRNQLGNLPADPMTVLGDLAETYDMAVRVHVQNIPEVFRQLAIDQIKLGMEGALEQTPEESDEQFELRRQLTLGQMQAMQTAINDLDQLTIGWAIDGQEKRTFLDVAVTAVAGSEMARQLAAAPEKESMLTGFLIPDAVLKMHANGGMAESDIEQSTAMLQTLRDKVMQEIEEDEDLEDDETKEALKEVVGDVIDVAEATVREGHINVGMAAVGSGPFTAAFGMVVADGAGLEKAVKKLVELGSKEPGFPEVELDAEKYRGVNFHKFSIPVTEENDEAENVRKLLGDPVEVVLAFAADRAFMAAGPKAVETIKQAMSDAIEPGELPPFEMSLSLAPILKYAAEQEEADPDAAMLVEELAEGGKDQVLVVQRLIPNGALVRIEAQEGVLKLIGASASKAAARAGAAGF